MKFLVITTELSFIRRSMMANSLGEFTIDLASSFKMKKTQNTDQGCNATEDYRNPIKYC